MKYNGKDKNSIKCCEFINKYCVLERTPMEDDYIEIFLYTKEEKEQVACIIGFLYDYKSKSIFEEKTDAFHIKTLGTKDRFLQRGVATFLMKEAIRYAEYKKVKHITVNPSACTCTISQEDLEIFYKKFVFTYEILWFKKEKEIEFQIILD